MTQDLALVQEKEQLSLFQALKEHVVTVQNMEQVQVQEQPPPP